MRCIRVFSHYSGRPARNDNGFRLSASVSIRDHVISERTGSRGFFFYRRYRPYPASRVAPGSRTDFVGREVGHRITRDDADPGRGGGSRVRSSVRVRPREERTWRLHRANTAHDDRSSIIISQNEIDNGRTSLVRSCRVAPRRPRVSFEIDRFRSPSHSNTLSLLLLPIVGTSTPKIYSSNPVAKRTRPRRRSITVSTWFRYGGQGRSNGGG